MERQTAAMRGELVKTSAEMEVDVSCETGYAAVTGRHRMKSPGGSCITLYLLP